MVFIGIHCKNLDFSLFFEGFCVIITTNNVKHSMNDDFITYVLSVIPRMTYEEHDALVKTELTKYYLNILFRRLPANKYEQKFVDDLRWFLLEHDFAICTEEEKNELRAMVDEYIEYADFPRMRCYLTPIALSFLQFPDYDEETNKAIDLFYEERYPEHTESNENNENE